MFLATLLEPIESLSASSTVGSVSTYSGTTSRSRSAGSTKRCSTLRAALASGLVASVANVTRGPPRSVSGASSGWGCSFVYSSGGQLGAVLEMRLELVLVHRQRRADRHVHVKVLVGPQPATEEHTGLLAGQVAVLQ